MWQCDWYILYYQNKKLDMFYILLLWICFYIFIFIAFLKRTVIRYFLPSAFLAICHHFNRETNNNPIAFVKLTCKKRSPLWDFDFSTDSPEFVKIEMIIIWNLFVKCIIVSIVIVILLEIFWLCFNVNFCVLW